MSASWTFAEVNQFRRRWHDFTMDVLLIAVSHIESVRSDGQWHGGRPAGVNAAETSKGESPMTTAEKIETRVGELSQNAVEEISSELRHLLADIFTLYLKTKNFHWHMTGAHFRDYHLLLDEHGDQLFAMTDPVAERARKLGGTTLHSISEITAHQRLKDNNALHVSPKAMLSELYSDNRQLTSSLRSIHQVCERHNDVATASLIEVWIDETERRAWFLGEIVDSLD
jgi:starvation-inducible DNA-binding protein